MCIPHGAAGKIDNGYEEEDKPKKHVKKVSQEQFEKGDPNFVDERTKLYEKEKKEKGFFESLFS